MRVVLLLLCLAAAALAQSYGSAPTTVTLKNSTAYSAGAAGVSSFLTAEDRRFTVALNWLRQDPATWKNFMASQGRWIIKEPFLVVNSQLQPNYALHYNPNIAAASAYHTYEMAVNSPTNSIAYDFSIHCPEPKKYPGTPCSPPMQYKATPSSPAVNVECFRREGCTDPTIDYYNRMDIFNTPIFPAPGSKVAGGNFYAGGDAYTNDLERGVSAAMAIACDSPYPDLPYNCTPDTFSGALDTGKEILYKPIGLRVHGAAYYAASSKKVNYFDTYFAAAPAPTTANPIASAAFLTVNGNGYFVANYREPSSDTAVPNQIGVVYQIGTGGAGVVQSSLALTSTSALVFTKSMGSTIFSACNASQTVVYAFYAVDSTGATYRYPEDNNLNACAGFGPSDTDLIAEPSPAPLVANGAIVFLGTSQAPPAGANPNNKPTVPFGGKSFAVATLPALALIFAALLAVLAL